ncbi:bacteriocin [Sphingorhabdus sp. Alg231-15]|uniref:bacteriocin n=1 Tax=Sphingorhabdus sp. Alg231-15 TaxID=1922222 RepID=UPI000D55BCCF
MVTDRKNEELNEDELDQVTGGMAGSAAMNSGVVKTAKPGSKIHGGAEPNVGIRKSKGVVASGGGNGI